MELTVKGLNSLCCLSWILSIGYWLGTWSYNNAYSVKHKGFENVEYAMFVVCTIVAIVSLLGCYLLFFEITNFLCVLIYVAIVLLVPGFSAYGMFATRASESISNASITKYVVDHWATHGKSPYYLTRMEMDIRCCGLGGPADYRHYIYGNRCQEIDIDVPYSCCNLTTLFHDLDDTFEFTKSRKCETPTKNIFNISAHTVKAVFGVTFNDTELQSRDKKCRYLTNQTAMVDKAYNKSIYRRGCLKFLVAETGDTLDLHVAFFFVFTGLSVMMLMWFCHIWLNSPEMKNVGVDFAKNSNEILLVEETKSRPLSMIQKSA